MDSPHEVDAAVCVCGSVSGGESQHRARLALTSPRGVRVWSAAGSRTGGAVLAFAYAIRRLARRAPSLCTAEAVVGDDGAVGAGGADLGAAGSRPATRLRSPPHRTRASSGRSLQTPTARSGSHRPRPRRGRGMGRRESRSGSQGAFGPWLRRYRGDPYWLRTRRWRQGGFWTESQSKTFPSLGNAVDNTDPRTNVVDSLGAVSSDSARWRSSASFRRRSASGRRD